MTQPLPPGWYPDPSGAPGTRYWDGYQWTVSPPRPGFVSARKRPVWPWILVGVVVLFLGGCGAMVMIGAAANNHARTSSSPSMAARPPLPSFSVPSAPSLPSITTTTKAPPAAIGQQVRDGDTVFTVTSIDQSKVAGDLSNPYMQVTAQGVFLNVHLTVSNGGNKPQTFFGSNQKLTLGDSTYEANGSAAMWTNAMNVTINPGNSIQAVVSFDIPANTVVSGTVRLRESILSPGVEVALS